MNVPNGLTTLSIITGFASFILLVENALPWAFTCYAFTVLLDRMDGIAARRLGQSSPLGGQLDSLADAVNFCLYPPLFIWMLQEQALPILPCLLLYVGAGVWRLAYFNIAGMEETERGAYFTGVPTTVCASWFIIVYALLHACGANSALQAIVWSVYFLLAAVLMLSSIPYAKNGIATKLLYLLIPGSVVLIWVVV
nr:CDP-alcohol phosphatidyltransferase family protein [Paenibacillus oenotherae]